MESTIDFDALHAASCQRLTLQLYAYLGDIDAARDAVQEAFCRALTAWRSIRADDPVAWVRRAAWRIATKRRPPRRGGNAPDALIQALATLPECERRVVILHHMARMPIDQIAAEDGRATATIADLLERGKTALAARLAPTREGNH